MYIRLCEDTGVSEKCHFCCEKTLERVGEVEGAPGFLGCTQRASSEDVFSSFSIYVCASCGLIQTDAKALEQAYSELHSEALGPTWEAHHTAFAQFIESHLYNRETPVSIIELGASIKPIARRLIIPKESVCYIDPIHIPPFDLEKQEQYLSGFFPEVRPVAKADIMIASHVLEHIPHTFDFFKKAWDALKPEGAIFISVPYFEKWLKKFFFNAVSAEHIVYPCLNQFQRLAELFSCSMESTYFNEHSLFVVFRKNQLKNKKCMSEWIQQFNKAMAVTHMPAPNRDIFIAGASHLSQYFLLCNSHLEKQIVGILDNSSRKWGKRLYGTFVKACSFETLKAYQKPFIFLPPSPYVEEMKKQILAIAPEAEINML